MRNYVSSSESQKLTAIGSSIIPNQIHHKYAFRSQDRDRDYSIGLPATAGLTDRINPDPHIINEQNERQSN